ncbi:MAG: hypothetical protein ACREB9_05240 [Thermoplasmata archaeon]
MATWVSVIVTADSVDRLPPMVPGADEVIVVGARGALARNAGAHVAKGRVLVFLEDYVRLEGAFWDLRRALKPEHWWAPQAYISAVRDPFTQEVCTGASLCATIGLSHGSIGVFQAVRRELFIELGGYRVSPVGYDVDMATRLGLLGERVYRIHLVAHVLRKLLPHYSEEDPRDPEIRRVEAELAEVPWMKP